MVPDLSSPIDPSTDGADAKSVEPSVNVPTACAGAKSPTPKKDTELTPAVRKKPWLCSRRPSPVRFHWRFKVSVTGAPDTRSVVDTVACSDAASRFPVTEKRPVGRD